VPEFGTSHAKAASSFEELERRSNSPRVLIIEDQKEAAEALERILSEPPTPPHYIQCRVEALTVVDSVQQYLERDAIDVYIVDLKLKKDKTSVPDKKLGEELVRKIHEATNAGIIVYSSEPIEQTVESLAEGADDYIEKGTPKDIIKSRVFALWRRIKPTRPAFSDAYFHNSRTFLIGVWRFMVGSRELLDERGNTVRISPLEHAFLSYMTTIESHEIDREHFNVYVLGRETYHDDRRIDNLVSRLRKKLGDSVQFIANRSGGYKLLAVREIVQK
jgi:DNA-binding response OmpR family regulator